ncbi:MAG: peptidoglycan-binding domain-containing protein [Paracoccaceae bacterium]
MTRTFLLTGIAATALAACQADMPMADVARLNEEPAQAATAPPDAPPDTCWGSYVTPAVVETVTEHKRVKPGETPPLGKDIAAPRYRIESRQKIVRERTEIRFETPCPDRMDAAFLSSLQRALKVRGLYDGPVTGQMDAATRRAVRRYQTRQGLKSSQLSVDAARKLGLVAYPRPTPKG